MSVPLEKKIAKPLVECAAAGNVEAFKALLEAGVDAGANYKEYNKGCTLLHTAVRGGSVDVVSAVLDAGADVNEKDSSSARSPLCEALLSVSGNEEVARRLVHAGADVDFSTPPGNRSPLSRAVSHEFERLAEDLLLKGANPNRAGDKAGSALACAASRGLAGTVSNLLRHGADKDKVNGRGDSPLILASKEGHLSTAKILLQAGAGVDKIGEDASALGVAAQFGHVDIMEAMIGAGAEVNTVFDDGCTALHYAAMNSEPGAVDALIKAGAKTEVRGSGVMLIMAASQEVFETTCALLRHGADPNAKDAGGDTALHMICTLPKAGFEKVVDELLLRGADKTFLDWDGCTPAGNLDVPDLFGIPDEQEFACEAEIERVRVQLQTWGPAGKRCNI